jgi:hypothetical protein
MNIETVVFMSVYFKDPPEYFEDALKSILDQVYTNFNIYLMVDGDVSNKHMEIIERLNDGRIRLFKNNINKGLATSLNLLIDEAMKHEFSFYARMDSDDISDSSRLQKQIDFLKRHPDVDILGSFCEEVNGSGDFIFLKKLPTTDKELKKNILKRSPFIHPTVVFKKRVFEQNIRYQTNNHLTEDMFLWVDLAKMGYVFSNIPEPLLKYRINDDFYLRRSGLRKALSEFRAKRYIAKELSINNINRFTIPFLALFMRLLPACLIKLCYRYCR